MCFSPKMPPLPPPPPPPPPQPNPVAKAVISGSTKRRNARGTKSPNAGLTVPKLPLNVGYSDSSLNI